MLFMVLTGGLIAARARLTGSGGRFETLQTTTGTYLGVHIVSHMSSVFVYARVHEGAIRTSGSRAPDRPVCWETPRSVRLLPDYALGVWSVITHAGCGLRTILLVHGIAQHAPMEIGHTTKAGVGVQPRPPSPAQRL
jgi:hypothetical protein